MLFFQELQTSSSSNGETGPHSRELLDELDLRRAHGRLCYGDMLASSSANIHKPWHSSIASAAGSLLALLDESTSQSSHSIQAMDVAMLRRSLAITAGPIPGYNLSQWSGLPGFSSITTDVSSSKKRSSTDTAPSTDHQISGKQIDRSQTSSPSASQSAAKKSRTFGRVQTTYHSSR